MTFIRGIITAYNAVKGKIARFSGTGRAGESFTDREAFQHFGFRSGLPKGTHALLIKDGQNIYLVASDSQYTIKVESGETSIYNQWGDHVILKKDHKIEVNAVGVAGQIEINADGAGGEVVVNAANIYLGDRLLATAGGGVVTMNCACITGGIHPMGSATVRSKVS